jgi:hypothetical protein
VQARSGEDAWVSLLGRIAVPAALEFRLAACIPHPRCL